MKLTTLEHILTLLKLTAWGLGFALVAGTIIGVYNINTRLHQLEQKEPAINLDEDLIWSIINEFYEKSTDGEFGYGTSLKAVLIVDQNIKGKFSDTEIENYKRAVDMALPQNVQFADDFTSLELRSKPVSFRVRNEMKVRGYDLIIAITPPEMEDIKGEHLYFLESIELNTGTGMVSEVKAELPKDRLLSYLELKKIWDLDNFSLAPRTTFGMK